ncbi:hypothetical protein WJX72_001973 [[Myrmecia] bisecta]|uniref:Methyltransferase domain-containing protein n=1 Tax=[Myrmecia] bisecta TaxID=41462 RepID=A0AAW1QED9_9CHLO
MRPPDQPTPLHSVKRLGRAVGEQERWLVQFVLLNALVSFVVATCVAQFFKLHGAWEQPGGTAADLPLLIATNDTSRDIRNAIYLEAQELADAALDAIGDTIFENSVVMRDREGNNRKYVWDFFNPVFNCPDKEKIGKLVLDGDGGKWLCHVRSQLQRPACVVYSFGSDGETSFEEAVIDKTLCQVHVFDPTLDAAKRRHVQKLTEQEPRLHFHSYGISDRDGKLRTTSSSGELHTRLMDVKKLSTIMAQLGHAWVDVLKMDVEGSEWHTITQWLEGFRQLPFTQLQVEYHYYEDSGATPAKTILQVLRGLAAANMRVFNVEPNYWWSNNGWQFIEYAYLQVDAQGNVVTGPSF